jgi:cell division protease FtsH
MVCEWGMSGKMGPLTFGKQEEQIFLGREIAQHRDYSEATAVEIDGEVKRIVVEGYDRSRSILEANDGSLSRLAEALLDHEVLDGEQVAAIVRGETLPARARTAPHESEAAASASPGQEQPARGPGVLPEPGKQPA